MSKELQVGNDIFALVSKMENQFIDGVINPSKYVSQQPSEDINKIEAYLNSKHISGSTDALGREKPFYNISISSRNIWFRATDLDRKDVRVKATTAKTVLPAFIATLKLQEWMRKSDFGKFLNDWGITLAGYNEAVVKFVEKEGELYKMVIPWNKLIFDAIDFNNNPVIEVLEFTPAQLKANKNYDQDMVDSLLDALTTRKGNTRSQKDDKSNYIRLYEVHGNLPLSYLTGRFEDVDEFVQQMHIISFVRTEEGYSLYSGREEKSPYILTALFPEVDGSVAFNGAVKNLFDAQWMVNHTAKQIKDQLDLASKLIFQTSDQNFISQNALTSIEQGDILVHSVNMPLTQIANNSHDITSISNYQTLWRQNAQEIDSTPDIEMGKNFASGTAYRQAMIVERKSNSNFEIMTENKGICLDKMMSEFILPYLKKTELNNKDEILGILEDADIKKIDAKYIKNKATKKTNRQLVEKVINGEPVTPEVQNELMQGNMKQAAEELGELGNKRFFSPDELSEATWKEVFKDLEWETYTDVTDEQYDTQAVLTTLSEAFQTVAKMGGRPMTPQESFLFNQILKASSIVSPVQFEGLEQPQAPAIPMGGQVGAGNLSATAQ